MSARNGALAPYVERLRELPFARRVQIARSREPGAAEPRAQIETPTKRYSLRVEHQRSHLSQEVAARIIEKARRSKTPTLLLAPLVGKPLGQRLREAGVHYMDHQGNC